LLTLAAPPIPPDFVCEIEWPRVTLAERSFFIIGGLGAEQKTQSIGRSPIDCESFLRAPIVNQAPRSERPTRAERRGDHRDSLQSDPLADHRTRSHIDPTRGFGGRAKNSVYWALPNRL
jgi:hypothetical protein